MEIVAPPRRVTALVVLVVYLGLFPSQTAHACSCGTYSTSEAFEKNDAIFVGKVIDERTELSDTYPIYIARRYEWDPLIRRQKATFLVVKKWKGIINKTLAFDGGTDTAACDYPINLGETYLFYGGQGKGYVSTSYCSRTKNIKNKEVEVEVLDRLAKGDSQEKIRQYLLQVIKSKREARLRDQAITLLIEEWDYNKESELAQILLPLVSNDPAPIIRAQGMDLLQHLDITNEEKILKWFKGLKDESAIVRQAAFNNLTNWRLEIIKERRQEIHSVLESAIEKESGLAPAVNPEERRASKEMVIDFLYSEFSKEDSEYLKRMFPVVLQGLQSDFELVRYFALNNLGRMELFEPQKKEALGVLRIVLEKEVESKNLFGFNQGITYFFKHGNRQEKKWLLSIILKELDDEKYNTKSSVLFTLQRLQSLNREEEEMVSFAIHSALEREKKLVLTDPRQRDLHRTMVQKMFSLLIKHGSDEENKRLLPNILEDFSNEFVSVRWAAFFNLWDLKPLDENVLSQLREIHRTGDPRLKNWRERIEDLIKSN